MVGSSNFSEPGSMQRQAGTQVLASYIMAAGPLPRALKLGHALQHCASSSPQMGVSSNRISPYFLYRSYVTL